MVTVQAFDGRNTTDQALTIDTDEKPCHFFITPIPENKNGSNQGSAVVFCL